MKYCPKCNDNKELNAFYKDRSRSDGRRSWCISCVKMHCIRKPVRRKSFLKTAYGISESDYEQMRARQAGQCAICGTSNTGHPSGYFCIDHDHTTGRVRGLLCSECNLGLGKFKDDPAILRLATAYLLDHQLTEQDCHASQAPAALQG